MKDGVGVAGKCLRPPRHLGHLGPLEAPLPWPFLRESDVPYGHFGGVTFRCTRLRQRVDKWH